MKKIKLRYVGILYIWIALLLFSCGSPKNTVINVQKESVIICYSQNDNYIILENIVINNSPIAGSLIFDTGSNATVIDNSIANELNLKTIRKVRLVDITGKKIRVPLVRIDSMNIDGAIFKNIYALVTDLSLFKCKNVKGLIGNNILKTGTWEIDLPEHKLTLLNPNEKFDYTGYYKIPFSYRFNLIKLQLVYNDKKIKNILFDTGSPRILSLSLKDKESESNMRPDYSYESYYRSLNKMQAKKITRDYYYLNINLNGIKVDSVLTTFKGKRIIGLQFFKKNTIVIDYKNNIIGIKKPFTLGTPDLNNVGVAFNIFNGKDIIISHLRQNSSADKSGIQVGDKVEKINDYAISEFLLNECDLIDSLNNMIDDTLSLKLEKWNNSKLLIPDKY